MIEIPTLLILGAGASKPYKFPLGETLLFDVIEKLRLIARGKDDGYVLQKGEAHVCGVLAECLSYSGLTSVDQFLESYTDNEMYMKWGKLAIVECLLPHEKEHQRWMDKRTSIDDDWYSYLWRHLKTPKVEDFTLNNLSIITFNYDRSLTEFLSKAIRYTYNLDNESYIATLLNSIKIIHVHGSLGLHPALPRVNNEKIMPYGGYIDQANGELAWDSIKVVHEKSNEGKVAVNTAVELIDRSRRIAYLGFGYLEDNLEKLQYTNQKIWSGKLICGSTYGMREGDMSWLRSKTVQTKIKFKSRTENPKCLEFLRATGFLNGENQFDRR